MSPKKTGEISTFTLNTGVVILRFKRYIHENEHDEVYLLPISSTVEWIFLWGQNKFEIITCLPPVGINVQ